jgi:hypothetical protein
MDVNAWKQEIEAGRREKDVFFASHPQSPLSIQDLPAFRGLDYWPPDPDYRFEIELHEHDEQQTLKVMDTAGQERGLVRWGEFRFRLAGEECVVQAYKSDPHEDSLFIPFRDATSGAESYGAGRYLDLNPQSHLTVQGTWVLDFNGAYNPWCAYSEDFACPFVPPENWLTVDVRAGEKKYPLGKE